MGLAEVPPDGRAGGERRLGWTIAIWFVSAILPGDSGLFSITRMKGIKDSETGYRVVLEDEEKK